MTLPSPLELAANAIVTLSIWLARRNSRHTWSTGVVGCGLFALLFWQARLYADVTLQIFFIATSLWGWWRWQPVAATPLKVQHEPPEALAQLLLAAAFAAFVYGSLLKLTTHALAPIWDSLILTLSVLGQLLLVRRRVESWPVWLLVNTLAVPLYAQRELYLTASLYALYWVNALLAWRQWRRLATSP